MLPKTNRKGGIKVNKEQLMAIDWSIYVEVKPLNKETLSKIMKALSKYGGKPKLNKKGTVLRVSFPFDKANSLTDEHIADVLAKISKLPVSQRVEEVINPTPRKDGVLTEKKLIFSFAKLKKKGDS